MDFEYTEPDVIDIPWKHSDELSRDKPKDLEVIYSRLVKLAPAPVQTFKCECCFGYTHCSFYNTATYLLYYCFDIKAPVKTT